MNRTNKNKPAPNRLPMGEAAFNQCYALYKYNAHRHSRNFELSKEEFRRLTQQPCFYCGCEPSQQFGTSRQTKSEQKMNGCYVYNGIDRLNNEQGYTLENSVPCCGLHNKMKRAMTTEEFIKSCIDVVEYQKKRAEDLLRLSLPKIISNN